jgi:hypothetical protein
MKKIKYWLLSLLLFAPILASAQGSVIPQPFNAIPGTTSTNFSTIARMIIYILLGVTGLIAVLFIIYGGFRYITSAGNDETAESAKKTIINAIIGLVVVILSYVIVTVIGNALIQGGTGV